MFTNIYYDTWRSTIHLWERDEEGNRHYKSENWVPYVFIPYENGETQTINGLPVTKWTFDNYKSYQNFQENIKAYENRCVPSIQYLAEKYHHIPNDNIPDPDLSIYSIDIEVDAPVMPKPEDAEYPIVLISIHNYSTDKVTTFGTREYTGTSDIDYKKCDTEKELINEFLKWWHRNHPDVVTGWNIAANNKTNRNGGFDLPYIINRSINLFGEENSQHNLLSPIGIVKFFKQQDSDAYHVGIAGVSILDYLSIYKWYTGKNLPNYKLETVAQEELGKGKLDYGDISLHELYRTDWNTYVEYNVQDVKVIGELESKLAYIKLAQRLALLCRCPMERYNASTQQIEGLLLCYYRSNNLCAPYFAGGKQESFSAAYVKEPLTGMDDWNVDLDIASSYPTHIIVLNMSFETFYGRIKGIREDKLMEYVKNKEIKESFRFLSPESPDKRKVHNLNLADQERRIEGESLEKFNKLLKKGLISVAPCGTCYRNDKTGIFSKVEEELFWMRIQKKKEMNQSFDKANEVEDEEEKRKWKEQGNRLNAIQGAMKIVLNGAYGITGVPYSRYFNVDIAEAIARCGNYTIKKGEKFVNDWFHNDLWYENQDIINLLNENFSSWEYQKINEDMVCAIDTDSLYIRFGLFLDKIAGQEWHDLSDEEKTDLCIRLSKIVEEYVDYMSYVELQKGHYNSAVSKDRFNITFKQEIVAKRALYIVKKKYGFHILNDEGVSKNKLKVTGLEMVRSETPTLFRNALYEILEMILKGYSDAEIKKKVDEVKKEAKNTSPEYISSNTTINNIDKYITDNFEPMKGAPLQVSGAANYKKLRKMFELENKYEDIYEGEKSHVIYTKPNPYGINVIAFKDWPQEFTKAGIVYDVDTMVEKFLMKKVRYLLEPMNRQHILEKNTGFDLFFS